jgi:hypothetical protein
VSVRVHIDRENAPHTLWGGVQTPAVSVSVDYAPGDGEEALRQLDLVVIAIKREAVMP